MRIGYLTYGLDRSPTGIGRYAVELLRAMAAQASGAEFVLLTTEQEDRHGLWAEFEHHRLVGCRLLPMLMTFGNLLLGPLARRLRLDLLHDPNGIAPFLGPAFGVQRVVTIHDAFAYVYPTTHNRLDNWRYRWLLPRAARQAEAVITVSECSQQDLIRYLGLAKQRVRITVEGIDQRFCPIAATPERERILARYGIMSPYLLYVGGLNARKNIARLIEAFALLREDFPALQLVIGGKPQWQTAEIRQAITRLAIHQRIQFTGYIHDENLAALYSAAEAFVFPSLYEGFGLPPLEAMACGTPVITSNVSSLPGVVGDAALLVDPFDIVGLSQAMRAILVDTDLRNMLRQRGLERQAFFRWEVAAHQTLAIYRELVGRARPHTVCPSSLSDTESL